MNSIFKENNFNILYPKALLFTPKMFKNLFDKL